MDISISAATASPRLPRTLTVHSSALPGSVRSRQVSV